MCYHYLEEIRQLCFGGDGGRKHKPWKSAFEGTSNHVADIEVCFGYYYTFLRRILKHRTYGSFDAQINVVDKKLHFCSCLTHTLGLNGALNYSLD